MNDPSLNKFLYKLVPGGTLFINSSIVKSEITRDDVKVVKVPVTEMALEMGNAKVLNIIMLGVYVGYTRVVPADVVWNTIEHKLGKKPALLPLNKQAFELGAEQRQGGTMEFHNFDEMTAHVKGKPAKARMAVAAAGDPHTIEVTLKLAPRVSWSRYWWATSPSSTACWPRWARLSLLRTSMTCPI